MWGQITYLRYFQLLNLEYKVIYPVENVGRQFGEHDEEQEKVNGQADLQPWLAQHAAGRNNILD